jgi:signal transduction histidine kinase
MSDDRIAALEAEIDRLKRGAKEAQDELVRKERLAAVGLLVASVAHEINTPLGIGVTAMSVLNDELIDLDTKFAENTLNKADLRRFLERATEASSLVASNLDKAAVQVANFRRAAVDHVADEVVDIELVEYVKQTLENLRPIARQGKLEVSFETKERRIATKAQPSAIAQLLGNFLTNSAAHGRAPEDTRLLTVKVSLALDAQKNIVLVYQDDGAGMEAEVRKRAFEPFFTTARTRGGSGLGLHIVQSLVADVLRGKLELETSPGKGVRFEITFPASG